MKSLLDHSLAAIAAAMLVLGGGAILAQQPGMPASPLAGGAAAASGNAFVDAHGNSVVMPASYGECAPYGAMCPDGYGYGGGEAGAAYADFGGWGPDQCGPYYFDIFVAGVALTSEDLFKDVPPLGSVGVLGPTIIDPANDFDDPHYGWQIAARLDFGPLSVIECTYMGLYDIGFFDQRISEEETARVGQPVLANQLSSLFSGYGLNPIDGLDEGEIYSTFYESDLQSAEATYRRYWVGHSTRLSGTLLAGFRYVRLTEELDFTAVAAQGNSQLLWRDSNDLLGLQFGGDAWLCLLQGLRVGLETKGGVYNNRYEFRHRTDIPDPDIINADFKDDGNQPAFVGEASLDVVADILPSFSIRVGYRALYLNSLVTVGNNIFPDEFNDSVGFAEELLTQADVIYHGAHAGLEYIW